MLIFKATCLIGYKIIHVLFLHLFQASKKAKKRMQNMAESVL